MQSIMRVVGKKPATYDDLMALPDNVTGQILDGEIFTSPRPAFGHARVTSVLGGKVGGAFDFGSGGPGGWWIIDEPEVHLGQDILVPDLAGWRRDCMPKPPAPSEPFVTVVPDWICEVLSPSTVRLDRILKKHVYAREGVRHLWLIDPLARALEVLRLEQGHWLEIGSFADVEVVRAEPFDAIELSLADLWLAE